MDILEVYGGCILVATLTYNATQVNSDGVCAVKIKGENFEIGKINFFD